MSASSGPEHIAGAAKSATVDSAEIAKFSAMADAWWDPAGAFKPLHRLNPVRLAYIRDAATRRFERDPSAPLPLSGLRVLDIGCGGGLLAEPLSRMGAEITGIDASERNIGIARAHALQSGARVTYFACAVEDLAGREAGFDLVLAMEVVEHVADVGAFVATSAGLVRPGGLLLIATLNRTAKAFALAIVGAEYVLRWLPRGTHDWRKFVKPSELASALRPTGLAVSRLTGVTYNPLIDHWSLSRDLDVNYMMEAERPGSIA
jgi:2-polyprenyl-6-hydroxyphenyl methylase/3-demethylubiquinone-9 3-methyltransferase